MYIRRDSIRSIRPRVPSLPFLSLEFVSPGQRKLLSPRSLPLSAPWFFRCSRSFPEGLLINARAEPAPDILVAGLPSHGRLLSGQLRVSVRERHTVDTLCQSSGRGATFVSGAATVNPVAVAVHRALPAPNAKARPWTKSCGRFRDHTRGTRKTVIGSTG